MFVYQIKIALKSDGRLATTIACNHAFNIEYYH